MVPPPSPRPHRARPSGRASGGAAAQEHSLRMLLATDRLPDEPRLLDQTGCRERVEHLLRAALVTHEPDVVAALAQAAPDVPHSVADLERHEDQPAGPDDAADLGQGNGQLGV